MSFLRDLAFRHCEERRSLDVATSGVRYYFMRLPRSLWLLAMTS
ncbi:hypothetical protein RFEPED_1062 [Rickettsia felis str. Pedreira]|uniref:Uncharacterized protein n=1 Tax=Rickettsia felis str. Pedreira TaxID=1359196 RepID=A0A0F3MSN9_RICFI|nr:hypothetical protein [Rickettsia felis]KJV58671.1 hypothetical protein RFEPED_1062 [Rickettsia felis str. Pedreira]